jgi:hypothetical protein
MLVTAAALAATVCVWAAGSGAAAVTKSSAAGPDLTPTVTWATAHDVSPPLRDLAAGRQTPPFDEPAEGERGDDEEGPVDTGYSGDGALQASPAAAAPIPSPTTSFEGLSNQDNFNIFGFRVNPPDPVGDVGPNHYVEMVNVTFAVYSKTGTRLLGPVDTGTLWANFAVPDCQDPSGDPIVV